ncbi:MAG TPA: AAA family ATPase [Caldimonas sp.]|nr:AAA family ATPase [Caldimonas sp.]
MADPDPLSTARERVQRLREHLLSRTARPVRLVETHISWVLLTDAIAYKLKKPVRLPFLDFGTLAARCHYSREELRINRRLAPWLYLDVVDVVETPGGPRVTGPGRVVDVALRMRRFPDGALWSERVPRGEVGPSDVDGLAATLAAFHASAPSALPSTPHGRAEGHARVVDRLLAALPSDAVDAASVRTWLSAECTRLHPHFEQRRHEGHVRECHGDLHLANVVQLRDRAAPFDAIEFDESLRWIDPVEDIAFLVMDLLAHGATGLAWRFLNAWLAATGDYEGLPALRYHLVCRALVRAQVCALREAAVASADGACSSAAYRALAAALIQAPPARLAITHGLPGAGKTHVAGRLAEAAGAVHVRSDVERKRLFGLAPLQRSDPAAGVYDASATARTYARLRDVARLALQAGWPVIVDAAFLLRDERRDAASLAAQHAAAFCILDCVATPDVLRARVRARLDAGSDASEADESVLERLTIAAEPLDADERAHAVVVDAAAASDGETLLARWMACGA